MAKSQTSKPAVAAHNHESVCVVYVLDDGKDPDKETWVESLKDPDMVYTPGHLKTGPEVNGKACNLNATLSLLFPAGSDVGLEEV